MRASILAVIAVAVIVALGMVFVVKSLGLLNPPPPPPPTETVVVPPPPPPILVLVPTRVIYEGDSISPNDVRARQLRPEELKEYQDNKDKYIPPVREITDWRYPNHLLMTDKPLKWTDLAEPKKPEPLHDRLSPGTRAISVQIAKERAGGGQIQVGDWVDVYLVTDVSRTDSPIRVPHTGLLVPRARVIAKRDSLFPIYGALPPGEPIAHHLAANPYRTALLEYGRTVGVLSIVPVSAAEKKRLDELRESELKDPQPKTAMIPFAAPGSAEFREEQDRIERYNKGDLVVGTDDLMRVLDLKPIPRPEPPPPPVTVEVYTGVNRSSVASFPRAEQPPAPPARYQFQFPTGPDGKPLKPNGK